MSRFHAVAAVTAALERLLEGGVAAHGLSDAIGAAVTVSAVPPDRVPLDGPDAQPRLNVFLYRVTDDPARRLLPPAPRDATGTATRPPLALCLHYLVTAYGTGGLQCEMLLGCAATVLNESPMLGIEALGEALRPIGRAGGVAPPQVVPHAVCGEEMWQLWSALQAKYRPSLTYEVRIVLSE